MRVLFLFVVFVCCFSFGAKKPTRNNSCNSLLSGIDISSLNFQYEEPTLVQDLNPLILKDHPHIFPLSGKLVHESSLNPGVTARGLFTCDKCNAHNQPHLPSEDGKVVCGHCGDWKTKEDGKYYLYPKKTNGNDHEGYVDINQLVENPDPKHVLAKKWRCNYCDADVTDGHYFCPHCNATNPENAKAVADAAEELARISRTKKLESNPEGRALLKGENAAKAVQRALENLEGNAHGALHKANEFFRAASRYIQENIRALATSLGIGITTGTLVYLSLDTTDYPGEIVNKNWAHSIKFERLTTVQEEGWCDSIPWGARNSRNLGRRFYGYAKHYELPRNTFIASIIDNLHIMPLAFAQSGWTDNDNGYFTRGGGGSSSSGSGWSDGSSSGGGYGGWDSDSTDSSPPEPIYKDWCSYEIDRWIHSRTERTSGTNPKNQSDMPWPSDSTGVQERVSKRYSEYTWTIQYTKNDGTKKSDDMSVDTSEKFLSIPNAKSGIASVNFFGSILRFKEGTLPTTKPSTK